jgi:hypothetical protein
VVGAEDLSSVAFLANYLGGHPDEVSAFVRWERERVRTYVGRLDAEVRANEHPDGARAIRYGNKRFWFLVHTLAERCRRPAR